MGVRLGERVLAEATHMALVLRASRNPQRDRTSKLKETNMAWTAPTLVEICIGLEINGYLPAEF